MRYKIESVESMDEIANLSLLARKIFREHFTEMLGKDQVEYMVEKFLSCKAIESQISEGMRYFSVTEDRAITGFYAVSYDESKSKAHLSKIYVKKSKRGSGLGDAMLEYIINDLRNKNIRNLWLVVNRNNNGPIQWYKKRGFRIVNEAKKDIGSGFFMDDFLMEKEIS